MESSKDFLEEKFKELIDLLKSKQFKNNFVDSVNDDIDIPFLKEKTEEKIFKKLYTILIKHVEKAVDKLEKKD
ncbi:hypothetical protein CL656_01655 [bacterium]|nr:hypothetical protein [bacterium]|tara:strand:+ start:5167 stop:5385 length:219 start_codon:yes stop_codon:yes gene_type:complete